MALAVVPPVPSSNTPSPTGLPFDPQNPPPSLLACNTFRLSLVWMLTAAPEGAGLPYDEQSPEPVRKEQVAAIVAALESVRGQVPALKRIAGPLDNRTERALLVLMQERAKGA